MRKYPPRAEANERNGNDGTSQSIGRKAFKQDHGKGPLSEWRRAEGNNPSARGDDAIPVPPAYFAATAMRDHSSICTRATSL
jgi:hypothetical protein